MDLDRVGAATTTRPIRIAANKDFDLIMLPNRTHGFTNEPYMTRQRWSYFARNLLGAEPPRGYETGKKPAS